MGLFLIMTDIYQVLGYDKTTLEVLTQDLTRYYITYRIKKRNGKTRRIDAPQEPLKSVQRAIVNNILYRFRAHPIAHGFVHGKSPRTNAEVHVGKKYILTIDIEDFFNSIEEHQVRKSLEWLFKKQQGFSYTDEDIVLLTKAMCFQGNLPQGAPTSPIMSNLVCIGIDKKLSDLAKNNNATITRYADDIALSGDTPDVVKLKTAIFSHIYGHGLKPNKRKTKIRKYYQRQQITGIVVNTKTSVKKEIWRNLRAQIHTLLLGGQAISQGDFQRLRGQIEWIRSLNLARGTQLLNQLSKITVI
jgi:retron-type reverse transcriptase